MSTSNVKLVKLAIGIAGIAAVAGLAGHFSDPGTQGANGADGVTASSSELRDRYRDTNPDIPPAAFAAPGDGDSGFVGRGDDDEEGEYEYEGREHEGREQGGALFAAPDSGAGQQSGTTLQRRRTRTRRS